jgi:hypothetical protein
MKRNASKRLEIKRETLRELSSLDLIGAQGGGTSTGSDVSNCCCNPTSNQGASCTRPPV